MRHPLALMAACAVLASCGSEPEPVAEPEPTPTVAGPRTLVAAGFSEQDIGAPIALDGSTQFLTDMMFDGVALGSIVSYVACPAPQDAADADAVDAATADPVEQGDSEETAEPCDLDTMADDAVYTYVHRVTPGEGLEGDLLSFRTTRPAAGFANGIGFDRVEAEAALGEDYAIGVQIDNGALIWRIGAGNGWQAGETITLFWQSTLPPAEVLSAYEFETQAGRSAADGPFPAPEEDEAESEEEAPTP